jgi:hypothetical protein
MIRVPVIFLMSLISLNARAQDVPPPPKPESRPSLDVTMKYIIDNMGPAGTVNFIVYYHDNVAGNDWTHKFKGDTTRRLPRRLSHARRDRRPNTRLRQRRLVRAQSDKES